jgi:hypothetical protein
MLLLRTHNENNVLISSIYQELIIGSHGLHWIIGTGRYRIVKDNLIRHLEDIVVTPRTIASIVKNEIHGVDVKTKPMNIEFILVLVFYYSNAGLIDLSDSSDEDGIEILYIKFTNMYVPSPCVASTL